MAMRPQKLPIERIENAETANAFLFGLIFNQNQRAEQAWRAPYKLKERLGTLDPKKISSLSVGYIVAIISQKPALHPFAFRMAKSIHAACGLLSEKYTSDARNIWEDGKTTREVLKNLKAFHGIGEHKASVGVFLLKNELDVIIPEDGIKLNMRTMCRSLYELYGEGRS